ncbi:hypothetical protein [Amnibacterium endophyticum]|uniref:Bacterial Ig domain-containing protein n=1 Tax=Amnibacterium endophyticum TaxID=2109337 RepID=A0ABW4LG46_9MICO
MKFSRALAAAATALALVLGGGAVSASADPVPQPLTLLTPTTGVKVASPYVTFTWQAPADQEQAIVRVSRSKRTKGGLLPLSGRNSITGYVDSSAGTFRDARYSYSPDTYYWQVTARDAAGNTYRSAVRRFVVPVFFQLSKMRAKAVREAGNGRRAVLVRGIMRCNYAEPQYYTQLTMVTTAGKRRLGRSITGYGNCLGMHPNKVETLVEPGSLKKGTKLTLKIRGRSTMDSTVRWGGAHIKKANGPVTTLHFTWRG